MVVMGWRSGCGCDGMERWVSLQWDVDVGVLEMGWRSGCGCDRMGSGCDYERVEKLGGV